MNIECFKSPEKYRKKLKERQLKAFPHDKNEIDFYFDKLYYYPIKSNEIYKEDNKQHNT